MQPDCVSADDPQFARKRAEAFRSGRGYQHVVFDPNARLAFAIKARFDREHHARLEALAIAVHDLRGLMHIEAKSMAGLMTDEAGELRLFENLADTIIEVRCG